MIVIKGMRKRRGRGRQVETMAVLDNYIIVNTVFRHLLNIWMTRN